MKTYLVNKKRFINYFLTSFALTLIVIYEILSNSFGTVFVLGIALAINIFLMLQNGTPVHMNDTKIDMFHFMLHKISFNWSHICEVGIVNTDDFGEHRLLSRGAEYVYLSSNHLTEEERFLICNNWPPKDKIYLEKTEEVMNDICSYYHGPIITVVRPVGK